MTGVDDSSGNIPILLKRRAVMLVLLLLALFAPIFCYVSRVAFYIFSATWIYSQSGHNIQLALEDFMILIPVTGLRVIYVYQVHKYYDGSMTRRKILLLGILADGPGFFMFSLMVIALLVPSLWLYISIPIPLLFLSGSLILWRKPLPESKTPWNDV
jgi:hypothetical protein